MVQKAKRVKRWGQLTWSVGALVLLNAKVALAQPLQMHIMEGYLPPLWCLFWFGVALPFWIIGFRQLQKVVKQKPETRLLLGFAGAFCFVLSALKIPSITGASSHPTGTGLGALLFGPFAMSILGTLVLTFQALLIAHGGLTTLGANTFSMAIVGPFVAVGIWRLLKDKLPLNFVVFLAAALADLLGYVSTSMQLALAYPDATGGFLASFAKFGMIFAVTQIPLAISEGILTVLIFNALRDTAAEDLRNLGIQFTA